MALVAAKCTQCGSSIEVDDCKEAGICRSCGTAFITEKVIHHHNTNVTQNITKNIFGREKTEAEEFLVNGETFIKLKDWEKAIKAFTQAAEVSPTNYRTWLGLVRSETKDFTDLSDNLHMEHLKKAIAVATEKEKATINIACTKYSTIKEEYDKRIKGFENQIGNLLTGEGCLIAFIYVGTFFGFMSLILGLVFISTILAVGLPLTLLGIVLIVAFIISIVVYNKKETKIKAIKAKMKALNEEMLKDSN